MRAGSAGSANRFRRSNNRLTIFTTNYLDTRKNEKDIGEILEDRIGTALRSRLYEMCKTVVIEGEDYRKTMANNRSSQA